VLTLSVPTSPFAEAVALIHRPASVLAEQHDEWAEGRYLGLDVLARAQAVDTAAHIEEVNEPELQALTA
jgi:putative transposase